MPQQQPTSLLSLPDELLVHIFDYLAVALRYRQNPVVPLLSVCRRIRHLAQATLYRDVVISADADATPHFQAVVEEYPSLGQLVRRLKLHPYNPAPHTEQNPNFSCKSAHTTLCALPQLKELTLLDMPTDDAAAILVAFVTVPGLGDQVDVFGSLAE